MRHRPLRPYTTLGADGRPAFVAVPYDELVKNFEQANDLVPNDVVKLAFDEDMSPARAWRPHLDPWIGRGNLPPVRLND